MKKLILIPACLFTLGLTGISAQRTDKITGDEKQSATFVLTDSTEWESIGDGMRRQIMGYDPQIMMLQIVSDKPGPVGVPHTHPHSQVTYVVSGKFRFTIGNESRVVSAGDGLHMTPHVLHSCECLEPGIIVDCFSPMRNDFLKE